MSRTIWHFVAVLTKPGAEPFAIIRADTSIRRGSGVEGEVVSLHQRREEAEARARELDEEFA